MEYEDILELFRKQDFLTVRTYMSDWEKEKVKINAEKDGNAILWYACSLGWYDISVKLIEDFKLDPNMKNSTGSTLLHSACLHDDLPLAVYLITEHGSDPCQPNHQYGDRGFTPLEYAIIERNSAIVQSLVEFINLGHGSQLSLPCIMTKAWERWDNDIIKCLINDGKFGLYVSGESGYVHLLHKCINEGAISRLLFLVDNCPSACADLDVQDSNGNTVLLNFCRSSFIGKEIAAESLNIFVSIFKMKCRDCKPDVPNKSGVTPLSLICSSIIEHGYSYFKCKILFCLLVNLEAYPHVAVGTYSKSVLSIVCQAILQGYYDPSILHFLIIKRKCKVINEGNIDILFYTLCISFNYFNLSYISEVLLEVQKIFSIFKTQNQNCLMCFQPTKVGKFVQTKKVSFMSHVTHIIIHHQTNFDLSASLETIKLFWYMFITSNIECQCNFRESLISHMKEFALAFSSNHSCLSLLRFLCMTFGSTIDQESSHEYNSRWHTIDHELLNDLKAKLLNIDEHGSDFSTVFQQNPFKTASIIICHAYCSSNIYSLFFYLINKCQFDVANSLDLFGNTLLHLACLFYYGDSTLIEYLLATGRTDPLLLNGFSKTPLDLLVLSNKGLNAPASELNIQDLLTKFGKAKISHPIESYVNIIVLGDPGVGKSTLVKVLNERDDVLFGRFRSITDVGLCTAGIVPHIREDKDLGRIIVHDLAGQIEYYSSHTAVLENLLQGSAAVFIIVVSLADERSTDSLHFWFSVAEKASHKTIHGSNHMFVVASHYDTRIENKLFDLKTIHKTFIIADLFGMIHNDNIFTLDCRRLYGGQLTSLIDSLANACQSLRSNTEQMSLYCHMLYDLLLSLKVKEGRNIYFINDLVQIIDNINECFLPTEFDQLSEVIESLGSTGLIMYIVSKDIPKNAWIIFDKSVLLTDLNGVLFAPEYFKEHVNQLTSVTGIVKLSDLSEHCNIQFSYDPDMLVQFLEYMELSHEINKDFLHSSNLAPSSEGLADERYLFIPALIKATQRPKNTDQFQFGWCLQCSNIHSFFLSLFIHLVVLHLLKYTENHSSSDPMNKKCHIWNNGIYWKDRGGVCTLVEVFSKNKSLILLMSHKPGFYQSMTALRERVIHEILSCKSKILLKTSVTESVISNTNLIYPDIIEQFSQLHLFSIQEFSKSYLDGKQFALDNEGDQQVEISVLLNGSDVKEQCESVFAGRDPKEILKGNIDLLSDELYEDTQVGVASKLAENDSLEYDDATNANEASVDSCSKVTLLSVDEPSILVEGLNFATQQENDALSNSDDPIQSQLKDGESLKYITSHPPLDSTIGILKKYYPKILHIVSNPEKLSDDLWSCNLLSSSIRDDIHTTSGIGRYSKVSMIMNEIIRLFEQTDDIEKFIDFCDVLKNHGQPGLDDIGKEMTSELIIIY